MDLKHKVGQATKWSSITELATKLVAPLTNMILARLLAPEMFGVIATLTMVVSFAEIFTDAGFQKYLVQHEFIDADDLDKSTNVAFWTNLLFSLILWGVIAFFATPITWMVGSEGCEWAIIVMSAQIPLLAFSSIQTARFRRDFNYKGLFVVRMCTALVPLVITVPLAQIMRNYWALVIGTLSRDVLNAIILTAKSKWKPQLQYSLSKLREMLSFSVWTIAENIAIWLTNYAGTFIVALYLSDYYLGLYKTTITTINGYMNLITAATTSVLFSALSRAQNDEDTFREIFFKFQRLIAAVVFPLGFGIFTFKKTATLILLGNQWLETADFLGLWALTSAIVIIFNHFNGEVFRSKGKPKISVLVQIAHIVVLIPVLMMVSERGFREIAIVRSLVRIEICLGGLLAMWKFFGFSFVGIIRNVWSSLLSAGIMAAFGSAFGSRFPSFGGQIVSIAISSMVYLGCMLLIPSGRRVLLEMPVVGNKVLRFQLYLSHKQKSRWCKR